MSICQHVQLLGDSRSAIVDDDLSTIFRDTVKGPKTSLLAFLRCVPVTLEDDEWNADVGGFLVGNAETRSEHLVGFDDVSLENRIDDGKRVIKTLDFGEHGIIQFRR